MRIGGERKRSGRQGRGISLLQVAQRSLEPFVTLLPSQRDALVSQGLSDFQCHFKVYFKAVLSPSAHLCPLQSVDIFLKSKHITIFAIKFSGNSLADHNGKCSKAPRRF